MSDEHQQDPNWLFNPVCSNQYDPADEPSTTPAGVHVVSEQTRPLLDIEPWSLQHAPLFSPVLRSGEHYDLPDIFFQPEIVLPPIDGTGAVVNISDHPSTSRMLEFGQPSGSKKQIDEEEDDVVVGDDILPLISHSQGEDIQTVRQDLERQLEGMTAQRMRTVQTHNTSERKRRNRISDKIKQLAELIPNCDKTNHKASILESAIKEISSLQFQLQTMTMNMYRGQALFMSPPIGFQNMQVAPPHFPPYHVQMRAAMHAMETGMGLGTDGGGNPMFSHLQPPHPFLPAPPQQLPVPPQQLPVPPQQLPAPPQQLPVPPQQLPVPPQQLPVPPQQLPAPTVPIRNQRPITRTSLGTSHTVHATQVVPPLSYTTANFPTVESLEFRDADDDHNIPRLPR